MNPGAHRSQKTVLNPLELELQVTGIPHVLGTELGSSGIQYANSLGLGGTIQEAYIDIKKYKHSGAEELRKHTCRRCL